jgi:methionine-rich copper-binding protein CopC
MSRSIRRAVIGAALLALLPLAIASSHAELDSASPGPDEVVEGSPPRLVARFTQDIAAERTSIEVRDADGQTIARGGKDPDRARVQRVELPALEPGTYEVRWVTFSTEDDELARGRYRFTVTEPPATPSPTVGPSPCTLPAATIGPVTTLAPAPSPEPALSPEPPPSPAAGASSLPVPSPAAGASSLPVPSPGAFDPCASRASSASAAPSPGARAESSAPVASPFP